MKRDIRPWQVWWAGFDPQIGREQAGMRPAVVVGTAFACSLPNDLVFLVPCTTTDRGLPIHPRISSIPRPTFAMCDQLKAVSRDRLVREHPARLTDSDIRSIRFVLGKLFDTE